MAAPLKAPGSNGIATDDDLVQAFLRSLAAVGDGYWRTQVAMRAAVPVTRLGGEDVGRALLPHVAYPEPWHAELLAGVAWGLALRGEPEAARRVLRDLAPLAKKNRGEQGTRTECVVACAHHHLGDLAACDEAFARAERFARGEKENPTQPWPILALARARCGRLDALLAQIGPVAKQERLSFDDERAATLAVTQVTAAGDRAAFGRWCAALREENSYIVFQGLVDGAPAALAADHGDALTDLAVDFAADGSYGADAGVRVVRAMMAAGQIARARRTLSAVQAAHPHPRAVVANAWEDLDDLAARDAVRALAVDGRGEHPPLELLQLEEVVRAVHGRDPAAGAALLGRCAVRAQAETGCTAAHAWASLCDAALAVQDPRAEAWIAAALTAFDAAPRGDYNRRAIVELFVRQLADRGRWEPALALLRKSTSKYEKHAMAQAVARAWLRAGDLAGALRVLDMGKYDALHLAMRQCDLLHARVGLTRPFDNVA
ncbi:MAG: hypothetical protein U0325_28320 [Polyangiales bacterium]